MPKGNTVKFRPAFAVIVPALVLCACSGPSKSVAGTSEVSPPPASSSAASVSSAAAPASTSAAPASTSATAASPAATPPKGEKPTREFVIGKWGTDGDCTLAIDLRPDGSSDGPFGPWSYTDGVISFPEEPDFKVSVTVIDAATMESTNGSNGKTARMTRCP